MMLNTPSNKTIGYFTENSDKAKKQQLDGPK